MANAISQSLLRCQSYKLFAFFYAGGQRLFAENVLACVQGILRHGEMLRVGRANVDRIDGWIA